MVVLDVDVDEGAVVVFVCFESPLATVLTGTTVEAIVATEA